jgi:hypothetical protein
MAVKKKTVKKKPVLKKKPAIKKKPVIKKKPLPVKKTAKKAKEAILGEITHYFPHVRAAVLKLKMPLSVGDTIRIKGHTTDFKQAVTSIQIDRTSLRIAKKGDEIGLLVDSRVRKKDKVTKL